VRKISLLRLATITVTITINFATLLSRRIHACSVIVIFFYVFPSVIRKVRPIYLTCFSPAFARKKEDDTLSLSWIRELQRRCLRRSLREYYFDPRSFSPPFVKDNTVPGLDVANPQSYSVRSSPYRVIYTTDLRATGGFTLR